MVQTAKSLLLESLTQWPNNSAINVEGRDFTYAQFLNPVIDFNSALQEVFAGHSKIAVLAGKTLQGYQCVASVMLNGKTYVPLNASYPVIRNAEIVKQSGVTLVLLDSACRAAGEELRAQLKGQVTLLLVSQTEELVQGSALSYEILAAGTYADPASSEKLSCSLHSSEDVAYILFTSGSTGKPKGVPVSIQNLSAYLKHITDTYEFRSDDRFSQFFEFTFDLSIHDILVCWKSGACLCVPDKMAQLMPLQFAAKQQLTIWFSVPSLALTAKDLLRKKFIQFRLPSLRMSFFCGEALPQTLAKEWLQITESAPVINLYGPTEATIAFTAHQYQQADESYPVVPIGRPFGKNLVTILDASGYPSERGELCLGGEQVFSGYWHADDMTQRAFHRVEDCGSQSSHAWYRSGDVVSKLACGTLLYHGRTDRQVQVNGFRVELQEVEHALRALVSSGTLAVVAYPCNAIGEPVGLTGFVSSDVSVDDLLDQCEQRLPNYMIPKHVISLAEFPYNSSGKLDYKRLAHIAGEKIA